MSSSTTSTDGRRGSSVGRALRVRSSNTFETGFARPKGTMPRKSHIPRLSTSKSTANRPQVRRPSNSGRPSNVFTGRPSDGRRPSSIYGERNPSLLKDTRPIKDHKFMEASINSILEFLKLQGYSHQYTVKRLMTPSQKDYKFLFECMYVCIDPGFTFSGKKKYEDEIPEIMKNLRYPFQLHKSWLVSPGSHHAWPHLLAALSWLLDLVEYYNELNVDEILFPFDSDPNVKLFFEHAERTYAEFMAGADTYEREEQLLEDAMKKELVEKVGDFENLSEKCELLKQELNRLQNEPDQLSELRKTEIVIKEDLVKVDDYISHMITYKDKLDQELANKETERKNLVMLNDKWEGEEKLLQQQLATQEMSTTDVQHLKAKMEKSELEAAALEKLIEDLKEDSHKREIKISKRQPEVEACASQYNSKARQLKLVGPGSGGDIDFEMSANIHAGHLSLAETCRVMPALLNRKKEENEKFHQINSEKIAAELVLDEIREMVADKREKIEEKERRIHNLDNETELFKEMAAKEYKSLRQECEKLEGQLTAMRMQQSMSGESKLKQAKEDLQATTRECDEKLSQLREEDQQTSEFMEEVAKLVVDHVSIIEESLKPLKAQSEADLKEAQDFNIADLLQ